jgi:4-hydroxybenzoyl-CoA thioesterase
MLAVQGIGRASLDLEHTVSRGETVLWTAKQRIVAVSIETNASLAWPDDIRAALTQHLETPHAHHLAT